MGERIKFNGIDPELNELVCPAIRIWRDWSNRRKGFVGHAYHGEVGELLERKGRRCRVKVRYLEGFVTDWFVKEL